MLHTAACQVPGTQRLMTPPTVSSCRCEACRCGQLIACAHEAAWPSWQVSHGAVPVPCWSGQLTQRRVVQRERFHGTWQYLFIESICNDPAVLEQNYRHKMMYSPDYSNVDTEAVSAHLVHCCALTRAAKNYVAAMAAEQRLQLGLGSWSCVRAAHRGGPRLRLSVTQVLLSMSRCVHAASGHACQCATWMLLELARADCMAARC